MQLTLIELQSLSFIFVLVLINIICFRDVSNGSVDTKDSKPYQCTVCPRGFHSEISLQNHLWSHLSRKVLSNTSLNSKLRQFILQGYNYFLREQFSSYTNVMLTRYSLYLAYFLNMAREALSADFVKLCANNNKVYGTYILLNSIKIQ